MCEGVVVSVIVSLCVSVNVGPISESVSERWVNVRFCLSELLGLVVFVVWVCVRVSLRCLSCVSLCVLVCELDRGCVCKSVKSAAGG